MIRRMTYRIFDLDARAISFPRTPELRISARHEEKAVGAIGSLFNCTTNGVVGMLLSSCA